MPSVPTFPERVEYAKALWTEAVRHLYDSAALHFGDRHPAAISSAMKAAELALKSVLVLDGAMVWWERLHQTHTPLTDIENNPILKRHFIALEAHDRDLPSLVKELERLAPAKPGAAGYDLRDRSKQEANPEYPFFSASIDPDTGDLTAGLHNPGDFFDATASARHYSSAHRLVSALSSLYSDISSWSISFPDAL